MLAMNIDEDYSLRALNTFGVAVKAGFYGELSRTEEWVALTQWQREHAELPVLLLGGGSNMLFTQDFPGLVLKVGLRERTVLREEEGFVYIRAGAGENWHDFVRWTIAQGYAGLENLSLIPGTVGAAPMQNIGAYGVELQDCFHSLQAIEWRTGVVREFKRADCCFAYRDSFFKSVEPGRWLISSVVLRLPLVPQWRIDYAGVREQLAGAELSARCISDAIMQIRRSKLPDPLTLGNAGSFFKNPLVPEAQWQSLKRAFAAMPGWPHTDGQYKLSAGWLIDYCGWKGKRVGDAGMYEQHALVLVNHGDASGSELWQLAQRIMDNVQQVFGVQLEPEPRII